MEYLEMFFELDFVSIILAIVTILLAWQFLDKLLVWFWEKTGIEFRHIRKRREEHELLMKTAENLSRLQEQHQEDVERVTQNDRKMQQEFSEFVEELKSALTAQREQMDIYAQNRINDREKSREVQRDFNESQKKLSESVAVISKKLDDMKAETDMRFNANEEKQNKKEQAKIKAEISNRYSIYHERKWITDIEFEALEGLISTYESFGGLNSFVHSVVQKEMFPWKKVNEKEDS